jgi:hypothetical protein
MILKRFERESDSREKAEGKKGNKATILKRFERENRRERREKTSRGKEREQSDDFEEV